jgi:hypothetical protein
MDEACQILNVTREAELAEVAKVRYRNILERQVEMLTLFICLLCRELLV